MPRATLLLCACLLFCAGCGSQGTELATLTPSNPTAFIDKPSATFTSPIPSSPTAMEIQTPTPIPSATLPPLVRPITSCASTNFIPIAFLPDNTRLLGRVETGLWIIDTVTGQEIPFFKPTEQVVAAALSADGQILALALENHSLQLIRMSDKKILATMAGHLDRISAVKFTPAGDG